MSVHILENGTKVSALNPKTYVFDPEKSIGDPEVDLIRTVNIPAVVSSILSTSGIFLQYGNYLVL